MSDPSDRDVKFEHEESFRHKTIEGVDSHRTELNCVNETKGTPRGGFDHYYATRGGLSGEVQEMLNLFAKDFFTSRVSDPAPNPLKSVVPTTSSESSDTESSDTESVESSSTLRSGEYTEGKAGILQGEETQLTLGRTQYEIKQVSIPVKNAGTE